jgi:3'-phosphoadenosine 5'-phosphosulfate sulfotransferase (PAPS reductase)/FAD synthetase
MLPLFAPAPPRLDRGVVTTPDVDAALALGSPVAIGVSGGKDSCALAFSVVDYLDRIGHRGARILIHSDLGRTEWRDSAPTCERLAVATGLELVTVRRAAGDMMDRWLTRWANNVERYAALECVKLILPWSTASMRFCTSELKTAVICRELVRRFPGTTILSAIGVRGEESPNRARSPIASVQNKLTSVACRTRGLNWNAIHHLTTEEVFALLAARGFPLHEGYTRYGMTRISCAFCFMASQHDIQAATTCPDNADLYREQVDLEIVSSFAFQGDRWLGDVAPHLLTADMREGLALAKIAARERERLEARIPEHLLYTKGWPTCMPTPAEADLLAFVRRGVADLVGLTVQYTTGEAVHARYAELMAAKEAA